MQPNKKPTFFSNRFDALSEKTNQEIAKLAQSAEKASAKRLLKRLNKIAGNKALEEDFPEKNTGPRF